MIDLKTCPICEKSDISHFLDLKDFMITKQSFTIQTCNSCGFHFTNPRPKEEEIGSFYKSDNYVSHSSTQKGLINKLYALIRNYTLKSKIKTIKAFTNRNKILDIGAGTGHFLNQCKINGYEVTGLEPDTDAKMFAKQNFNLDIKGIENLYQLQKHSFDIITMWHVLEHVYHLNNDFNQIISLLNDDGYLFVAVPNLESFDAHYYKEYWAAYDVPRHLYHFNENDIKNLASKHNLQLVKTLPMTFDSFYVSMLSEKYKKGNIFNAFIVGLKSNIKAKKFGYSSQIYVLKKTKN